MTELSVIFPEARQRIRKSPPYSYYNIQVEIRQEFRRLCYLSVRIQNFTIAKGEQKNE